MASLVLADLQKHGGFSSPSPAPSHHQQAKAFQQRLDEVATAGLGGAGGAASQQPYPPAGTLAAAEADAASAAASGATAGFSADRHYILFGSVSTSTVAVFFLFLCGVVAYMSLEGLKLVDAMYLSTGVITTVGLLIVPRTAMGRLFTACLNVLSLGVGVLLLTEIAESRRSMTRGITQRAPCGTGIMKVLTKVFLALSCQCESAARFGRESSPPSSSNNNNNNGGGNMPISASALLIQELCVYGLSAVPLILLAAAAFHSIEGWPMMESLYFCLLTASGLGMGDVEPRHWTSRLLFVFYLWANMGVMLGLLGSLGILVHDRANVGVGIIARVLPGWCGNPSVPRSQRGSFSKEGDGSHPSAAAFGALSATATTAEGLVTSEQGGGAFPLATPPPVVSVSTDPDTLRFGRSSGASPPPSIGRPASSHHYQPHHQQQHQVDQESDLLSVLGGPSDPSSSNENFPSASSSSSSMGLEDGAALKRVRYSSSGSGGGGGGGGGGHNNAVL